MSTTDPIADLFTRIRNAILIKNEELYVPHSRVKADIVKLLKEDGYIKFFEVIEENKFKKIKIVLRYDSSGASVISELKRVSKPGCRVYVKKKDIPKVLGGIGLAIISTCKGLLSGKVARISNVGGEFVGVIS